MSLRIPPREDAESDHNLIFAEVFAVCAASYQIVQRESRTGELLIYQDNGGPASPDEFPGNDSSQA